MNPKRLSRKKFLAQVNADVAKIQADAVTAQMIAEALVWHYELTPDQIQETVRRFLEWKEAGSPELESPVCEPTIAGVVCPPVV